MIERNHVSYVRPNVEIIEIEVEQICAGSNLENPEEGTESEW